MREGGCVRKGDYVGEVGCLREKSRGEEVSCRRAWKGRLVV